MPKIGQGAHPEKKLRGAWNQVGRPRACLKCDKIFVSVGNHNRLCDVCRSGNALKMDMLHDARLAGIVAKIANEQQ